MNLIWSKPKLKCLLSEKDRLSESQFISNQRLRKLQTFKNYCAVRGKLLSIISKVFSFYAFF